MTTRSSSSPKAFDEYPKTFVVSENFTRESVLLECVPLTREIAERIDRTWWSDPLLMKGARQADWDGQWNWVKLLGGLMHTKGSGYLRGWAARSPDGAIQGAILYWTNRLSYLEMKNKKSSVRAIYVDRLATAPGNRPNLVNTGVGRHSGVGTGLLNLAVAHSYFLKGGGRILLDSFAREETIGWYQRFGLAATDIENEGTILMELPEDMAAKKIRELRLP